MVAPRKLRRMGWPADRRRQRSEVAKVQTVNDREAFFNRRLSSPVRLINSLLIVMTSDKETSLVLSISK